MPKLRLNCIDAEVWEEVFSINQEQNQDRFISKEVLDLIQESKYDYQIYERRIRSRRYFQKLEAEEYLTNIQNKF